MLKRGNSMQPRSARKQRNLRNRSEAIFIKTAHKVKYAQESFNDSTAYYKGLVLSLVGVMVVTTDALMIRLVSEKTAHETTTFYRYGLSAFVLMIIFRIKSGKDWLVKFFSLGKLGLLAGLVWGANEFLFTFAIQNADVATVLVIFSSNPMFAAIISNIILGEKIPYRTILMCAISFGIIIVLFINEFQGGSPNSSGIIAAVFSALASAMYFVLLQAAKKFENRDPDPVVCNMIAFLVSTIVSLIFGANPAKVNSRDMVFLCLSGVLEIPISLLLVSFGATYISATEVSLIFLLETILSPVWVYLAGFEQPPKLAVYCGVAFVVSLVIHSALGYYAEMSQPKVYVSYVSEDADEDGENKNFHSTKNIRRLTIAATASVNIAKGKKDTHSDNVASLYMAAHQYIVDNKLVSDPSSIFDRKNMENSTIITDREVFGSEDNISITSDVSSDDEHSQNPDDRVPYQNPLDSTV